MLQRSPLDLTVKKRKLWASVNPAEMEDVLHMIQWRGPARPPCRRCLPRPPRRDRLRGCSPRWPPPPRLLTTPARSPPAGSSAELRMSRRREPHRREPRHGRGSSAVLLLRRRRATAVLTAINSNSSRQLFGNNMSFTLCSIHILFISNEFHKFWMSFDFKNRCTKNEQNWAETQA